MEVAGREISCVAGREAQVRPFRARLNPIQESAPPEMRKVLQFQRIRHPTLSILSTISLQGYGFLCKLCNPVRAADPLSRSCEHPFQRGIWPGD
jgi:hypothetical protein